MSEELSCIDCGCCCLTTQGEPDYALVHDDEPAFEKLPWNWIRTDRDGISAVRTCVNAQGETACVALAGKVGEEVSCLVYDDRPEACRRFEAGSMACEMARSAFFGSDR